MKLKCKDYDCFIVENVTCEYCGVFVSNFVNYGYGLLQIIFKILQWFERVIFLSF